MNGTIKLAVTLTLNPDKVDELKSDGWTEQGIIKNMCNCITIKHDSHSPIEDIELVEVA